MGDLAAFTMTAEDEGAAAVADPEPTTAPAASEKPPPVAAAGESADDASKQATVQPAESIPKPAEELFCSSERGEIPSANEAAAFIKSLDRFLQNSFGAQLGQQQYKIPRLGGQDLDLASLYRTVLDAGGHDVVTQTKMWKTVGERMQIPPTVTSQSTSLKQHYHKFLLKYERNYRSRKMVLKEYGRSDAYAHLPRDDVEQIQEEPKVAKVIRQETASPAPPPAAMPPPAPPRPTPPAPQFHHNPIHGNSIRFMYDKIVSSVGPFFVLPSDFKSDKWDSILKALESGTPQAMSWSLNVLSVLAHETKHEIMLTQLPGLLEALLSIINRALLDMPVASSISDEHAYNSLGLAPEDKPKAAKGRADALQEPPMGPKPAVRGWWWEIESHGITAPDDVSLKRSMFAVAAAKIIRNASFSIANKEYLATIPYCVICLSNCLSNDVLQRLGTDGESLRFDALDTLSNIGSTISLPKHGMVGIGLMQSIAFLLGAPVMGERQFGKEVLDRSAIMAADLLSQLSLGTENAGVLSVQAAALGLYAWLTAHLQSKNESLVAAAITTLSRLMALPGQDSAGRFVKQRWAVKRTVDLATNTTDEGPGAITATFEAANALLIIAGSPAGKEALAPYEARLQRLAFSEAKQAAFLCKVLGAMRGGGGTMKGGTKRKAAE